MQICILPYCYGVVAFFTEYSIKISPTHLGFVLIILMFAKDFIGYTYQMGSIAIIIVTMVQTLLSFLT